MSNYLSFVVKHPPLDLTDKEACKAYCERICRNFVEVYSVDGDIHFFIDDKSDSLEFSVFDEDDYIATVELYRDFFVIDPFFDDWELLYTGHVGAFARKMMKVFCYAENEFWYFNDDNFLPVSPWECENLKDYIERTTEAMGGHLPEIDTAAHTIDGIPYEPKEMFEYKWIAYSEKFRKD